MKMDITDNNTLVDILHKALAEKISVDITIKTGRILSGNVLKVGQHIVVIKLKGNKSFFDAIIRVDAILVVEYQARTA